MLLGKSRNFRDLAVLGLICIQLPHFVSLCSRSPTLAHHLPSGLSQMVLQLHRRFGERHFLNNDGRAIRKRNMKQENIQSEAWVGNLVQVCKRALAGPEGKSYNCWPRKGLSCESGEMDESGREVHGTYTYAPRVKQHSALCNCSIRHVILFLWTAKVFRYLREHKLVRCADEYDQNSPSIKVQNVDHISLL
jgi:hypothetical protein